VAGNWNFSAVTDGASRFTQTAVSALVSHPLPAGWSAYVEAHRIDHTWLADVGIAHPLGHNAQIDTAIGRDLSGPAPSWFVTTGIAFRHALRCPRP
jgi:hypothetical protein